MFDFYICCILRRTMGKNQKQAVRFSKVALAQNLFPPIPTSHHVAVCAAKKVVNIQVVQIAWLSMETLISLPYIDIFDIFDPKLYSTQREFRFISQPSQCRISHQ